MTRFLTIEDALAAAQAYLGRRPEVRDYGLLESALMRPQATVFGQDAYPDLNRKAAALLSSLVGNHPLIDGNKRLGWVCTRVFYIMNDADVRAPEDDAYDLVAAIANHEQTDVEAVAPALAAWVI
ncbi:MAG TPA: type II toxin-antitoxin system death-on-curing family toxin [Actinomycetales bacterium]|nr:type II toxin-antitoxin system death-on-curing family toxin [Actinomycetales bacterium]